MSSFTVRRMEPADVPAGVGLQKLAFPPPFPDELHWDPEHLLHHIEIFPDGQFVAVAGEEVIGTCSNTIISEERWQARENWYRTVGGPDLRGFDRQGTTLYGIDITVHPSFRKIGVGRAFYETRFDLVRHLGLTRYGTACRIPDYAASHGRLSVDEYAREVVEGRLVDRTLTPLLRYGLTFLRVLRNFMPDPESEDSAALLDWKRT